MEAASQPVESRLTRYPSLSPSSSSPDSFRMAGTTLKKGKVCGAERSTRTQAGHPRKDQRKRVYSQQIQASGAWLQATESACVRPENTRHEVFDQQWAAQLLVRS